MTKKRGAQKKIYELIKKREKISLEEIRSLTVINHNTIRGAVVHLTNKGLIERIGRGIYKIKKD